MKSYWTRVGPKPIWLVFIERGEEIQAQREDGHVKTEEEILVMLPHAKECLGYQELEETGRILL